jgi:hypothetical protein
MTLGRVLKTPHRATVEGGHSWGLRSRQATHASVEPDRALRCDGFSRRWRCSAGCRYSVREERSWTPLVCPRSVRVVPCQGDVVCLNDMAEFVLSLPLCLRLASGCHPAAVVGVGISVLSERRQAPT